MEEDKEKRIPHAEEEGEDLTRRHELLKQPG
jgi:hypothetical protein